MHRLIRNCTLFILSSISQLDDEASIDITRLEYDDVADPRDWNRWMLLPIEMVPQAWGSFAALT